MTERERERFGVRGLEKGRKKLGVRGLKKEKEFNPNTINILEEI